MELRKIGELGLIRKISKGLNISREIIQGIGDDAAVLRYKKSSYFLLTTDMLIEGTHFKLKGTTPSLIGRKALAVNISDIAAMGGVPRYAVVALGVSPKMKVLYVKEIFAGIRKLAKKFNLDIVGGDTNKSNKLIINMSLIGEVEKKNLVLRNGAKVNDAIFLTGRLGGSYKSQKHLKFTPRLKEARFLVRNFKINSMIDISDGLTSDLTRIIESSNAGALIDASLIPVQKGCNIKNALSDGEDFELLFTASEIEAKRILRKWPYKLKLTKIGKIVRTKNTINLITKKGLKRIKETGFRHF